MLGMARRMAWSATAMVFAAGSPWELPPLAPCAREHHRLESDGATAIRRGRGRGRGAGRLRLGRLARANDWAGPARVVVGDLMAKSQASGPRLVRRSTCPFAPH